MLHFSTENGQTPTLHSVADEVYGQHFACYRSRLVMAVHLHWSVSVDPLDAN